MIQIRGDMSVSPQPANGQICAMFAADIADFTRADRNEEIQLDLRAAMYDMLRAAFDGAGVPWDQCHHNDCGDGARIIIPPGVPAQSLIDPIPERLRGLIRRRNRIVSKPAQLQLRAAVNMGPVYHDDHGFTSEDVTLLCRMVDAGPLRSALASSAAELALIVSPRVYDSLVRQHPSLVDPALFWPMVTIVKQAQVRAWIHVPGTPPP